MSPGQGMERRKKNEVVQEGPVEGLQDVQDEVATSKLLLFYCYYGIREQKKKGKQSQTSHFRHMFSEIAHESVVKNLQFP